MSIEQPIGQDQIFQTYRFGRAKQLYRGPKPDLTGPYLACIGGSETFGKFVDRPWPDCLSGHLGLPVANFGTPGAGPGFFLKDPVLLEVLSRASACVVQTMTAWSNSNRLFSVRKRRNERVQGASEMLCLMYPEIEPAKFRFVHKMLGRMHAVDPKRFRMVELELRQAWTARMRELLDQIETRRILLWFSERRPEDEDGVGTPPEMRVSPAYVTRDMVEALRPMVDEVVECVFTREGGTVLRLDQPSLPAELIAARTYPSQTMHEAAGTMLAEAIGPLLR
jgi:hypothetical protein